MQVENGLVQGTTNDGLIVFKGIPFAAPPVGDLRWKAPQPIAEWDTVLQADNFAKTGNPNGDGLPEWPTFSDETPDVLYFGPTLHVGTVPSLESLHVVDAYFQWRRTPEGKAWAK